MAAAVMPSEGLGSFGSGRWDNREQPQTCAPLLLGTACRLAAPPGVDHALPPHALEDIAQGPCWLQIRPDLFRAEPCLTTLASQEGTCGRDAIRETGSIFFLLTILHRHFQAKPL